MQLRKHDNNAICETKIQSFPMIIIITLHYTCKLNNNIIMVCYKIVMFFPHFIYLCRFSLHSYLFFWLCFWGSMTHPMERTSQTPLPTALLMFPPLTLAFSIALSIYLVESI